MQEVRHDNIRVSYVMPGSVATGFGGRGAAGRSRLEAAPEDVAQVVIDLLAHRRAACRAASSCGRRGRTK